MKIKRFEIFLSRKGHGHGEQPSKATQQMKAMEPRLVEKHACRVVLHGCHQQSPPRWFQEKETHSYIWKRNKRTSIVLTRECNMISTISKTTYII